MACETLNVKNLGLSRCNELPDQIDSMIETNTDFAIPAATLALGASAVKTYLDAALLAGKATRIYQWPKFNLAEDISVATVYEDSSLSYIDVAANKYRFRFSISQNLCLHKAMYTHRRTNGRVYLRDRKGYLLGTLLSTGYFAGLSIELLNPEGFKFNDGTVATKSPILVALANSVELNANGYMFNASSFVYELESIVDVSLTVIGTPTATSIVVDVKTVCDNTAVSGLVFGDFVKLTTLGVSQSVTSSTESTAVPGRYSLVGTGWTTGTIDLKAANLLTIQSYESSAAIVTI